jgi:hypothetical protein
MIERIPFMLRLSKHSEPFFSNLPCTIPLPRAEHFVEQLRVAFKIIKNFRGRKGGFDSFHQTRLLG